MILCLEIFPFYISILGQSRKTFSVLGSGFWLCVYLIKVLFGKFKLSPILSLVIIIFLFATYEDNFANYLHTSILLWIKPKSYLLKHERFLQKYLWKKDLNKNMFFSVWVCVFCLMEISGLFRMESHSLILITILRVTRSKFGEKWTQSDG